MRYSIEQFETMKYISEIFAKTILFRYNSVADITNVRDQLVNENYSYDLFQNFNYTLNKTVVLKELKEKFNNS